MILVLNKDISPQQDARLTAYLEGLGLTATRQLCQGKTILLLSGQTDRADAGGGCHWRSNPYPAGMREI